jgi:uncharacterized protein YndB with AHSA1/START domain
VTTDRIEKKVLLRASRGRVWRALTDSGEFGSWFGMRFEGPFVPDATMRGVIAATKADAEIAKAMEPVVGIPFVITIERIEPERLFSFRWHPHALDQQVDYSKEPTTLVVFELEDAAGGILLKVTESGFDRVPLSRRKVAFDANEQGWAMQMTLIEKHLARRS